ncbi:uncharacterized protein [Amphiura filiformis]|uniref:uncharacterized protein n=1 Tax=Amphiura filiformis TaxID=82378 RepID=UPI003B20F3B8
MMKLYKHLKKVRMYNLIILIYFTKSVYVHKYTDQKDARRNKKCRTRPDKNLLQTAIKYFTDASELHCTNFMALLDHARTYERLPDMKENAKQDFENLVTMPNLSSIDKLTFSIHYARFLQRTYKDANKAAHHFRTVIKCAVDSCTLEPITWENPQPQFVGKVNYFVQDAITNFSTTMTAEVISDDVQRQAEGLKGLAWLHFILGEHEEAQIKYEKYLKCEGRGNDMDAICNLIHSLIQLEDFESAREMIHKLEIMQKQDLAKQCKQECALRQGLLPLRANQQDLAHQLFQEAVEDGSMTACYKLAEILMKTSGNVSTWEFAADCAKIIHCCQLSNHQADPIVCKINKMMDVEHQDLGKLRSRHLDLEQSLLDSPHKQEVSKAVLDKVSQVLTEARSVLDRIMIQFQTRHYPERKTRTCTFFHVQNDYSNHMKTGDDIKGEIKKRIIKNYKWEEFDTKFPDLFDFFVQIQPAYPGNRDNWYLALSQLAIRDKHLETLQHSQYYIPIILNGKTGVTPVPVENTAASNAMSDARIDGVEYECFTVVDVARWAATKVEHIVAEIQKYL